MWCLTLQVTIGKLTTLSLFYNLCVIAPNLGCTPLNPQVRSWFAGIHVHRSSVTDLQGTFLRSRCSHSMGRPLSDPTHAKRTRQHLLSSLSERGAKIGVSSGARYISKLPYVFDVDTVVSFHSAMGMGKPRGRGRC